MSHWTGDFGQLENAQHSRSNGSAHTLCYGPNTTPTLNQACIGQQGKNKHNRNPNVDANGNENGNVPQHTQQHTEPHYATPQQPQSAAVKFYELQTQQQEQEQQQQQAPQYKTHPIEPVPYYLGALQISGNTARPEHIGYNCGFGANNNNTPKPTPRKRKIPKLVLNPLCKVSRSSLSPEETRTYTPHSWLEPEAKSVSPPTGLNAAIEIGAGSVPAEHHFTPEQKKPEGQEEEEIEQNRPWLDDKDAQLPTLGDLLVDLWPEHDKDPYTTEQGEEAEDDDFIEVLEPTDCAYTVPPPNISVTSNEKSQKIIEEISDSDSDSDSDSGSASASGSVSDPTSDPASDPNSDPNSDPTSDSNSDLDDSVLVEISDSDQEESPPKSSALSSKAGEQEQKEAQSLSNEPPIYTLTHHDNGKKEEAYPSVSTDTVEDNIVLHTLELPAEGPQLAVEQNLQSRQPTAGEEHPATEQQPETETETEALSLELAVLVANVDISQPDEKVPDQKPKKHLVETIYLTLHVIGATIKRIRSPPSKHHLKEIVHCKEKLFELWKQLILVSEPELSAEQLTPLIALHRDIEHIERLEGDSMGLNLLNKLRNILKGWTHPKDEIGATGDEAQSLRNEAAANAGTQGLGNRTDRKRSGGKLENSRAVSKYRCVESNFPSIISHPIADDMPTTSASSSMAEQHQASGPVSVSRLQIPSAGNKRLSIFNEPRTAPQIVRYHGLGNNQIDLSDDDEPPVNGSIFQSFASGRTTASSTEWGLNGQSSSHGNAAAAAAAGAAATSSLVRPSMLYADAVRLGQNGYSEQPHTSMNGHGHGHGHHPHHSHALRGSHNHNESLLMHVERRSEREQYANFLSDVAFNEFRSNQTSRTNLPPLLPMTSWNAMLKKNMERTNAHTQHALADHSSQVQQAKGKIAKPIPPPPPTLLRHSVFYLNSSDSKSGSSSPPPPQLLSAQVSIKAAPQPVIIDLDSSSNEKPAAKSESDQQKRLQAMQKRFSESIFFSDDYEQKFREREQRERAEMDHQRELARIEAEKLTQERRRLEASFRWTILELNLGSYAFESATVAEETEAELEIEFIPISEAQQKELLDIVTGPDEAPLITKYGLTMLKKDIRTMTGLFWLNDEVINFYMNLLTERSQEKAGTLPSVYAMNTFFLPRLLKDGFNSVRRWTRKIDVISKDIIVVPVHCNGMHWCIAIIHLKNRTLFYYDSLGKPNNMALEALKNYIKEESLDKRKQPYDMSDFKIENILNGPQQTNGSDCGVFSCMTAEYICRDKPLTFSQEHMPYFRKKMILEIVHGKLWK